MLRSKIIFSSSILVFAFIQLIIFTPSTYTWLTVLLSLAAFGCAVKLGLLGKHLIDVILPGTYVPRKKKKVSAPVKAKPNVDINEQPTEN